MASSERIYLTGMMGAGKTTLGGELAASMNWNFADTDEMIENKSGRSVPEIFRDEGERGFRQMEDDVVHEVSGCERCVVALGGGALMNQKNLDHVLRTGTLVYLRVSWASIVTRLDDVHLEGRPLLHNKNKKDYMKLFRDREPGYESAHIIVDMDGLSQDESVDVLRSALSGSGFLASSGPKNAHK